MSKKMKLLGFAKIAFVLCAGLVLTVGCTQENDTSVARFSASPYNLTVQDIFVSYDFSPLNIQCDFSRWENIFYNDTIIPNYLDFRRSNNCNLLQHRTLLYITHKDSYGENSYVVYGINYGFEYFHDVQSDEISYVREMYLGYLQGLFESLSVEELMSFEESLKITLYSLRMFIDGKMITTGINMYLSFFQVSPLFDLFDEYTNNAIFSTIDFTAFSIENGICRPAATVTIVDDSTIILFDEDITIQF